MSVHWVAGVLQEKTIGEGYYLKNPLSTRTAKLSIVPDTDELLAECGTKLGTMIEVRCEIVNTLHPCGVYNATRLYGAHKWDTFIVKKNAQKHVNAWCSENDVREIANTKFAQMAPYIKAGLLEDVRAQGFEGCVDIGEVRVWKPKLPRGLQEEFDRAQHEEAAAATARVVAAKEREQFEAKRIMEISQREKEHEMQRLDETRALEQRENERNIAAVGNKMAAEAAMSMSEADMLARKHRADAEAYAKERDANASAYAKERDAIANKVYLTDRVMQQQYWRYAFQNTKTVVFDGSAAMKNYAFGLYRGLLGAPDPHWDDDQRDGTDANEL